MNSNFQISGAVLPAPRLHPFLRLLICVVGVITIQILVSLILMAGVAVAASMQGVDPGAQAKQFFSENLLLLNLFIYPPTLLWLWICRRLLDRRAFVSLGLHARSFPGQFLAGLLCGFLACALIFGVLVLSGNAHVSGWSLAAQSGGWQKSFLALLGWFAVMLCVGFMEEISFRGYVLHNLTVWLGATAAIAIQAVLFALVHLSNLATQGKSTPDATLATLLAMPNIALIGVFFALCYFKNGSLWFPIAFHAAWNFFLGCIFSLPVSGIPIFKLFDVQMSGSTYLTGGSFGPEASLLLTPILIILNFVIAYAPTHPQALFDLQSLRPGATVIEGVLSSPLPEAEVEAESNSERANRFKTRMGKATRELDADTMANLRALNEQSQLATNQRNESPFIVQPLDAQPVVSQEAQAITVASQSTPPAVSTVPTRESTTVATRTPEIEKAVAKPEPIVQPPTVQPATPSSTPSSTPPTSSDNERSTPPRKPAPRW